MFKKTVSVSLMALSLMSAPLMAQNFDDNKDFISLATHGYVNEYEQGIYLLNEEEASEVKGGSVIGSILVAGGISLGNTLGKALGKKLCKQWKWC